MKRKNATRSALFTSIVSLLLCVSMLTGTTFAWFTDSVSSGTNVIAAGNLDIELEYWKEDKWVTVDGATDLFSDALWEPGHTRVVYLKVSNLGSLALKYDLSINIVSETKGTNVADETFKLSDHIYMSVVKDAQPSYTTRDEAIAAAMNGEKGVIGAGYSKNGTMVAGQNAEYLSVVVYMPEIVGNEANHKTGTDRPEINLGISLFATQLASEEDSFDETYDEDAFYPQMTYYVNDPADLAATLATLSAATDIERAKIVLNTDVEWETGAGIGSTPWIAEGSGVQELLISGNGKTITATGSGVGAIRAANGGTIIFNNVVVKDLSESYAENSWEYGYLEFDGNVEFYDSKFVNAVMMEGDSAKFVRCSFNSHADNQYAVWVSNGTASFEDCLFEGARGLKTHEAYGSDVASLTVDNCTFKNLTKKPGVAIGTMNADTAVSITNSTFLNCQAGDQGNFKYESDTDVTTFTFTDSNNTVLNETTSDHISAGFKAADGSDISGSVTGVVFGTKSDYPEITASYSPVSTENGVSVYQVANSTFAARAAETYTVYYLTESAEHKVNLVGDCTGLFRGMSNLVEFDASNLDMSQVTSAEYLFRDCKNLETITGAEDWDTSNMTSTRAMFYNCEKLKELDVSKWDVSKVENAGWMFYYCKAVTELDVSDWDTSSLTFAKSMFCNNENLESLAVDNWDMSKVTDTSYMFFRCYKLADMDLSKWDVSKITTFESMFKHARSVSKLDLSTWDTSSAVDMNHMFANCGGLVELDISGFDTSKVTTMAWMFYEIEAETIYIGDKWSLESIANVDEGVYSHKIATAKLKGGKGTTCDRIMQIDTNCVAENGARINASAKYMVDDGGMYVAPGLLTKKVMVAKVGDKSYATLQAAVDAAPENGTVTLLSGARGKGAVIDKSITIDFQGYSYFLTSGVGDNNDVGLLIKPGHDVTLKSQKEASFMIPYDYQDNSISTLVETYSNLTVDNVDLNGMWMKGHPCTTLSVNSGEVALKGEMDIYGAGFEGSKKVALNVVKGYEPPVLTREEFVNCSVYAAAKFSGMPMGEWKYFATLQQAVADIENARENDRIELMRDIELTEPLVFPACDKAYTLALWGKNIVQTINSDEYYAMIVNNGTLKIMGDEDNISLTNNGTGESYAIENNGTLEYNEEYVIITGGIKDNTGGN